MSTNNDLKPKIKRDRYSRARGGNSALLDLFCTNCNSWLFLYRKDGPGSLIRCYLDRIINSDAGDNRNALKCPKCGQLIGVPMIYVKESRPAIRLIHGAFRKAQH